MLVTFHNGFMFFFASRSCFKHKYTYIHTHTYTYTHTYTGTHIHTQVHMHVHIHVHVHVRVRVGGRGEERRVVVGGSVGGWVGEYVLVRVCVVCADSFRSVPQDENGAQQLLR